MHDYEILENEQIADEIFRLRLKSSAIAAPAASTVAAPAAPTVAAPVASTVAAPAAPTVAAPAAPTVATLAVPGQFINIYLPDGSMLLPRPFGIADVKTSEKADKNESVETDTIEIVYAVIGKGTRLLSAQKPGQKLRVLGPLGNGFDLDEMGGTVILVGGGLGIPPLHFVSKQLAEMNGAERRSKTIAVLGYREKAFYQSEMEMASDEVYAISDTPNVMTKTGNVIDLLEMLLSDGVIDLTDATILSCGPAPMLKAVAEWSVARNIPARMSLEARMGCGYGACVGCSIKLSSDLKKKVCTDGPIFRAEDIVWNEY